jgi:O-antigen/teichoic acid export membrane protein
VTIDPPARAATGAVRLRERARAPATLGLAGKGVELLTQALLVTAVPAAMGPGDYGEFALALSVVMIASASFTLGGPAIMTRFVPAASPESRDAVARALLLRLGRYRAAQVLAAAVVAAVLSVSAPDTFPPLDAALVVTALALDVAASVAFQTALGFGHAGLWSFRFPFQNVLLTASALALYEVAGTTGAIGAIALASGGALLLAAPTVVPRLLRAAPGAPIPAGAMRFGLFQAMSSALGQLQQRGGIVAVAILYGSRAETGFASLAVGIPLAVTYAVRQAFTVQLPGLVERSRDDTVAAEAGAERLARRLQLGLMPAALAGALWAGDGLQVVLGQDYAGATEALEPAFGLLPLAPLVAMAAQVAALRLRPEVRLRATAWGTLVFLAVAGAVIPWAGAVGATAAFLAGTFTTLIGFARGLPGSLPPSLVAGPCAVAALAVVLGAVT